MPVVQALRCLALVVAAWPVTVSAQDTASVENPVATTEATVAGCPCMDDLLLLDGRLTAIEEQLRALGIRLGAAEAAQGTASARLDAARGKVAGLSKVLTAGGETHDGFLLRFALGAGYLAFDPSQSDGEWRTDGISQWTHIAGGGLNIAIGGTLRELHVYGEVNANYPQLFAFGLGLGGYFADNWFFDVVVGYQLLVAGYGGIMAGKEWWIGPQWAMGIALRGVVYGGPFAIGILGTLWTLNWTSTYN